MTEAISTDLKTVLRRLKLSRMLDTLPERLVLARQQKMPHQDLLLLALGDEVARRDSLSASVRAQKANLDSEMQLELWDATAKVVHELGPDDRLSFTTIGALDRIEFKNDDAEDRRDDCLALFIQQALGGLEGGIQRRPHGGAGDHVSKYVDDDLVRFASLGVVQFHGSHSTGRMFGPEEYGDAGVPAQGRLAMTFTRQRRLPK